MKHNSNFHRLSQCFLSISISHIAILSDSGLWLVKAEKMRGRIFSPLSHCKDSWKQTVILNHFGSLPFLFTDMKNAEEYSEVL